MGLYSSEDLISLIFREFFLYSGFLFFLLMFWRIFRIFILSSLLLWIGNTHASSGELIRADTGSTRVILTLPIFPPLFIPKEDSAIDTFTSKYIGLSDSSYAPDDLERITLTGVISEAGRSVYLRWEARSALWKLAKAFQKEFGVPLVVISGYRSATYQKRMWDLGKCTDTLCAPPGYSEHQLGLAIDIFDATTEEEYYKNARYRRYITWFQEHAHEYGWHQSYQNGEYIDAYEIEPWHWRYLGIPLATKLKSLDISYTQYIRFERILAFWKR